MRLLQHTSFIERRSIAQPDCGTVVETAQPYNTHIRRRGPYEMNRIIDR